MRSIICFHLSILTLAYCIMQVNQVIIILHSFKFVLSCKNFIRLTACIIYLLEALFFIDFAHWELDIHWWTKLIDGKHFYTFL